ncbi:MAG: nitrile hydratase accessory protein, partial [Hyphomicrobiales bacterium]|nr:nitrile hydratase accessory protein [Hyphomicrobiales bacterium]
FREPWEAQAFALAVALHHAKLFAWTEWTTALSREISASQDDAVDSYYRCWLAALERLVVEKGAASLNALGVRKEAWARAADATPHGQTIRLDNDPERASPAAPA